MAYIKRDLQEGSPSISDSRAIINVHRVNVQDHLQPVFAAAWRQPFNLGCSTTYMTLLGHECTRSLHERYQADKHAPLGC